MKKKFLLLATLIVLITGAMASAWALHKVSGPVHAANGGDWPMFMGDLAHTGMTQDETQITPLTASQLHYSWRFATSGYVVASPTIVGGVMYIGSWDGNEYAIDLSTHQQLWKQFLGVTVQTKACYSSPNVGVTSTAAVQNGAAYVAGGDGYMYALNTSDGSVIWRTLLDTPPYYNYSSPVVYNGRVYIGLAAYCDPPFVQGKVIALDTATGNISASVSLVPSPQTGATVWSSLAIDTATNTVFATTGNHGSSTQQPYAEAFVSMDATTLAVKDHWQTPANQKILDGDFGSTPTLFDINGTGYIGALNKNDVYYVLNRNNLAAGPIWEQTLGPAASSRDDNNVSSSCYNNGVLYTGSGSGVQTNGQAYGGTVEALDAATGTVLWSAITAGKIVASITCLNGLVIDNQGNVVEVRDATNGNILYRHSTTARVEGSSVISNGVLYTPSTDTNIYAFTLPSQPPTPTPTPPATPTLTPPPTPSPTPSGGTIFQDNFDAYAIGPLPTGTGTNQWTQVHTSGTGFGVNVSNAQTSSPPNSLQISLGSGLNGTAWVRKDYAGSATSHSASFSLYLDSTLKLSHAISVFTAENRTHVQDGSFSLWLAPDHTLTAIWYDSQGVKHHLNVPLANKLLAGQWYSIEIDQTNDSTNGSWSLSLNGTQLLSQSGIDMGNTQVNTIIAGDSLAASTTQAGLLYIDNLVTSTQHIN